jgi:hypothetical protein
MLVDQNSSSSWNQIAVWLRCIDGLQRVAIAGSQNHSGVFQDRAITPPQHEDEAS